MNRGKFITFEGCDGSGKSTQLELFKAYLEEKKIPALFTREPGGGKISEAIRGILLDGKNNEMTASCEALLYAAARTQMLTEMVLPALDKGLLVVSDRYVDSSIAYQAYGRRLDEAFVTGINVNAWKGCSPDATVFIDLSPKEAFERKHGADENDRLEQAGLAFHERVYAGYLRLCEKYPERIIKIDGRGSKEEIFGLVLDGLRKKGCID